MLGKVHPESMLGRLGKVPDPRNCRGRIYPLVAILSMLLAGALEGEGSLRGMWMRGRKYWRVLMDQLGVLGLPDPPCLSAVWYVLTRVDVGALGEAVSGWVGGGEEAAGVDGKHLRGSKRKGEGALRVIALAGHRLRQVMAQRPVEGGDEVTAAVRLLSEVPLAGRVVSMDAGLMERPVVKTIMGKGGPT